MHARVAVIVSVELGCECRGGSTVSVCWGVRFSSVVCRGMLKLSW